MHSRGLPYVLRVHPAIVIVEFGGNDGLRGLPVDQTRANLDQVLSTLGESSRKNSAFRRNHACRRIMVAIAFVPSMKSFAVSRRSTT